MYKKLLLLAAEALLPLIIEALVRYLKKTNEKKVLSDKEIEAAEKVIKKSKQAEEEIKKLEVRVEEKRTAQKIKPVITKDELERISAEAAKRANRI